VAGDALPCPERPVQWSPSGERSDGRHRRSRPPGRRRRLSWVTVSQPPSAIEQARTAWRRAIEDTQHVRGHAEAELRRVWALLSDALEDAFASGMSLEDIARRLGLTPAVVHALVGTRSGSPA